MGNGIWGCFILIFFRFEVFKCIFRSSCCFTSNKSLSSKEMHWLRLLTELPVYAKLRVQKNNLPFFKSNVFDKAENNTF